MLIYFIVFHFKFHLISPAKKYEISTHRIGVIVQSFIIFETFVFLIVLENPELAQEKPIIPEVIISANDIGTPNIEAIQRKIPEVDWTEIALIKHISVIPLATVSIILPPNIKAPKAIKNPTIKAASFAFIKSNDTRVADALAELFAPAKKAKKHPDEINAIFKTRLTFFSS
tara:strand:+ start:2001 stop:2516 length:516 start_codon:yes stop_codon:yes gene_type:complete